MMHWMSGGLMMVSEQGVVQLSGGSAFAQDTDISGPYQTIVGFRVNTDGTIDKFTATNDAPSQLTQINADTDWIVPNEFATLDYQFKLEVVSGNAPNFDSDAVDTWLDLGPGMGWSRERTVGGSEGFTWKLSVRRTGGPTLASANYVGTIANGSF